MCTGDGAVQRVCTTCNGIKNGRFKSPQCKDCQGEGAVKEFCAWCKGTGWAWPGYGCGDCEAVVVMPGPLGEISHRGLGLQVSGLSEGWIPEEERRKNRAERMVHARRLEEFQEKERLKDILKEIEVEKDKLQKMKRTQKEADMKAYKERQWKMRQRKSDQLRKEKEIRAYDELRSSLTLKLREQYDREKAGHAKTEKTIDSVQSPRRKDTSNVPRPLSPKKRRREEE
jgi:hypothetical protein